jgi:hypothetical protein
MSKRASCRLTGGEANVDRYPNKCRADALPSGVWRGTRSHEEITRNKGANGGYLPPIHKGYVFIVRLASDVLTSDTSSQRFARIKLMICQRCCSGRCAKDGIPCHMDPLRNTQNNVPGAA